ncbi:putative bifunctional diguanylate cyclase/phosphodiesterase [Candidatus Halocynthiibacter alkanivorans]|jgi:diguanylate cyclase (GGDEF)-like protein|uniref:putative bifunctional diguanylate cyclase/phosphodiesterase n=1 Tax=Candidatus Halocynthiibacter alkanivorans TaxID=2267619 RepID=UPI000DF1E335|nr:bifunctional diguanylate cyclase/phosphodiesterase [Candidatus Halocynthiibacter alkanivorans]
MPFIRDFNALRFRTALRSILLGPQLLAFLPAISLGGYWYGGEGVLLFIAILFPAIIALAGLLPANGSSGAKECDSITGLPLRASAIGALNEAYQTAGTNGHSTACLVVELDEFPTISRTYGTDASDKVLASAATRLRDTMRDYDLIAKLDGPCFAIAMAPRRRVDLEGMLQIAARIQGALSDPFSINATRVYVTSSIGFCTPSRAPSSDGAALLAAAERALVDAQNNGPSAIRAYSPDIVKRAAAASAIAAEVGNALENGQITPWFQPQVSTDTGEVTGLEALARWQHPERGLIPPAEFLPAIADAGLFEHLGDVMLNQSLAAIQAWDNIDINVPNVAVNFAAEELSNPKLVDKLRWELDRFDLTPDRLTVEILEDVIASSDNDTITRNIWALSEMGCRIDLDDFGTGHASIANIRRFAVDRIKIDRSYVTRVDVDRDQQNMAAAILTMAERLDLETLAEGVETVGEHSMLAQLGCGHIQGFSVARPMPFDETTTWMRKHREKLATPSILGRHAG